MEDSYEFEVKTIDENGVGAATVKVAVEAPLTIFLDERELVTMLCTPTDLDDLVRGFIFGLGIVKGAADIKKISIDAERSSAYVTLSGQGPSDDIVFKRVYTSGCGRGIFLTTAADALSQREVASDLKISASVISSLMTEFKGESSLHTQTRGVHSAALSLGRKLDIFMDDIGRHNAIDKVIGAGLAVGASFANAILLTSGRITSEVIMKMERANIPIVASKSAPTDQAIKLGRKLNIALVGAVRGKRMNIYSADSRILT
ncbi:MAG: formate dehydrogenase accessory sulfurtransferase FdhD [Actinomycetota bacterium]|nr:formate dehydrogenase accessory sulfurtransferase FdhD [Actinomycetota bacterium]